MSSAPSTRRFSVLVLVTITMLTVGIVPAVAGSFSSDALATASSMEASSDEGPLASAPSLSDELPTIDGTRAGLDAADPDGLLTELSGLASKPGAIDRARAAAERSIDHRPFAGIADELTRANLGLAQTAVDKVAPSQNPSAMSPEALVELVDASAGTSSLDDTPTEALLPTAPQPSAEATPSLEDALHELAESTALPIPLEPSVRDAEIDQLEAQTPNHLRAPLASLISATSELVRVNQAIDWMDADAEDRAGVLEARQDVLQATVELHQVAGPEAQGSDASATTLRLAPLVAVDLSTSDTVYEQDYVLQVDIGGDDVYLNNAGGSGVDVEACPEALAENGYMALPAPSTGTRAAVLLDLGGDDTYGDPLDPRSCGANGGAWHGVGVLVDTAGQDTYAANGYGANGGGHAGAGLLLDVLGADVYRAANVGTNGGGAYGGIGTLVDGGGWDRYEAGSRGTNGGASHQATGLLLDFSGSDTYEAGGSGTNGGAHQEDLGILETRGILIDLLGEDTYRARSGGVNGGGTHDGVGFLFDTEGNDTYQATARGANGGGATGGQGVLVDVLGDDVYEGASPAFLRGDRGGFGSGGSGAYGGQALGGADAAGQEPGDNDRFILGMEESQLPQPGDSLFGATVTTVHEELGHAVVELADPEDAQTLIQAAVRDNNVRWIEPEQTYHLSIAEEGPNDPLFEDQYGPQATNAPEAWQLAGTGERSTVVCIVDTGVNPDHEDLVDSVVGGRDIIAPDTQPIDDHGHGTHLAGTIAAGIDNSVGIAGMADVGLYVVKSFDEDGRSESSTTAMGIQACIDAGVDVINLSFRGPPSRAIEETIQDAWRQDILVVAAAGNSHCRPSCTIFPASYPEVVAVGCTDAESEPCWFTSHSIEVEVAAPGASILSAAASTEDGYRNSSGTSMAAPHVAGAGALLRSTVPDLSNEQVRELLRFHAVDVADPGCDVETGYGIIDVEASLAAALQGEIPDTASQRPCTYAFAGINGGAFDGGTGLLVEADGQDTYRTGDSATNGGTTGGAGALVDLRGDDTYMAGTEGANGGGDEGRFRVGILSGMASVTPGLPGGLGVLFDGEGTDTYEDADQGARTDESRVPSGVVGVQFDSDDPDADPTPLLEVVNVVDPGNFSVFSGIVELEDSHVTLDDTLVIAPGAQLVLDNVTVEVRDDGQREYAGDEGSGFIVAPGGNLTIRNSDLRSHPDGEPGWTFEVHGQLLSDASRVSQARQILVEGPTAYALVRDSLIENNTLNGAEVSTKAEGTFLNNTITRNGFGEADPSSGGLRASSVIVVRDNVLIGNANRGFQLIVPVSNPIVDVVFENNVIAHQYGARAILMQDFIRLAHDFHGNLLTGNCLALSIQGKNDAWIPRVGASDPIFAENTIVNNVVAGANFGFTGSRAPLNDVLNVTLPLVDTWLGPDGATFDSEDRNYLFGPWDVSQLAEEDPNPHLWDKLKRVEEQTGIRQGPCG